MAWLIDILLAAVLLALVALGVLSAFVIVPWWAWVGIVGAGLWLLSIVFKTPYPAATEDED